MKITVSLSMFRDGFQCRKDNFSYEGLEALFDYLTEYENDLGEDIEFDPIAICCEYSEHESVLACAIEQGFEPDEEEDEDEQKKSALEYLQQHTQVIEFSNGIIMQDY
jgi:hypothetical protein